LSCAPALTALFVCVKPLETKNLGKLSCFSGFVSQGMCLHVWQHLLMILSNKTFQLLQYWNDLINNFEESINLEKNITTI